MIKRKCTYSPGEYNKDQTPKWQNIKPLILLPTIDEEVTRIKQIAKVI